MADINKFTTKEVLNKVLLDSSGDAVAAYSHTSQEALNAVLDSANSRLNVSLVGGTISGDVTISGDLTVTGDSAIATNEVIQGTSIIDVTNTEAFLVRKDSDAGNIFIVDTTNNQIEMYNTVGINVTPTLAKLQIRTTSNTRGLVIEANDSNASYMQFTNTTTGTSTSDGLQIGLQTDESAFIDLKESTDLAIATAGTTRMTISSAGLVGIGGTPSALLSVGDSLTSTSTPSLIINDNASYRAEFGYSESGTTQMWFNNTYANENAVMQFRMGGNTKMTIKNNGNVGIGASSPSGDGLTGSASPAFEVEGTYPVIQVSDSNSSESKAVLATNGGIVYLGGTGTGTTSVQTYVAGNIRLKLDANSRISLSNNASFDGGTSNTVFGKSIGTIDGGSNNNVFIGEEVASDGTLNDATNSVIIGYQAGEDLTTADNSVFIGYHSGKEHAGGGNNTAIGASSMSQSGGGNNFENVFVGTNSGSGDWGGTCQNNTAIGANSMKGAINGAAHNTAVGYNTLAAVTSGDNNIAIGNNAGAAITGSSESILIGKNSGTLINNNSANGTVAIGHSALTALTSGASNTVLGYLAGAYISTGASNTFIGYEAGANGETDDAASNTATDNIAIGFQSMGAAYGAASAHFTATKNVAIGRNTMKNNATGTENVTLGYLSGELLGANGEARNVIIGSRAGGTTANASADDNVVIGYAALGNSTTQVVAENVFIGKNSGSGNIAGEVRYNTAVGMNTMAGAMNIAENNTALGHSALNALTTGDNNVAVGFESLKVVNSGNSNVSVGAYSGYDLNTGFQNVFVGQSSGENITDGDNNVLLGYRAGYTANFNNSIGIGYRALYNNTADSNIAIGYDAGFALTSGASNTAVGYRAGLNLTTSGNNVIMGYDAFVNGVDACNSNVSIGTQSMITVDRGSHADATVNGNIAIGYNALAGGDFVDQDKDLVGNIAIGKNALDATGANAQTGTIAIGHEALTFHTSIQNADEANTVIGYKGMWEARAAAGNVAVGYKALHEGRSTNSNTAVGFQSLYATRAGSDADVDTYNTAIGYKSGDGITSGIQCTALGANTAFDVDANNQTAVGYGATTDSANDIAIGNTSVDEVKGQVDFSTFSDKRIKKDIKDGDLGLDFINELKVRKFKKVNPAKYPDEIKKENDGKDVEGNEFEWTDAQANKVWDGLIAQEVKEAMDKSETTFSGWSEESNSKQLVTYSTMVMPLIKAVQELSARVKELESK